MAFVVAYYFPWTALDELLRLIDALFRSKQELPTTRKYLLRKLWAEHNEKCAQRYYYCAVRGVVVTTAASNGLYCHHCKTMTCQALVQYKGQFFTILKIKEQIQPIVSKTKDSPGKHLIIRNRLSSSSNEIKDIVDGKVYINLWKSGALSFGDIPITLNTDGSPIYKSSNVSVWPIQLIVNELKQKSTFHLLVSGDCGLGLKTQTCLFLWTRSLTLSVQ